MLGCTFTSIAIKPQFQRAVQKALPVTKNEYMVGFQILPATVLLYILIILKLYL